MRFKLASIRPGVQVVEVFTDSGEFLATIIPGEDDDEVRELRVIKKRLSTEMPSYDAGQPVIRRPRCVK